MKKFKSWFKREDGVALVLTALCLTAIVSMMALVIDLGIAAYRRAEIQAVCDVTALATARYLNRDTNDLPGSGVAQDLLVDYGQACFKLNANAKYPPGTTSVKYENTDADYVFNGGTGVSSKSNKVTVSAKLTVETNFARVMGFNEMEIHVNATAYSDFAEDPDSVWVKSIVGNESFSFAGAGAQFASVHGNKDINFGNNIGFKVETSIATATGTIQGVDWNKPTTSDGSEPEYKTGVPVADIGAEGQKMLDYLNAKPGSNPNNYVIKYNAPKTLNVWSNMAGTETFFNVNGANIETTQPVYYNVGNNANMWAQKLTVKNDMYINGDMDLSFVNGGLTIETGVTLYITGDLKIGNGLVCKGNLVILGDLNVTGAGFSSPNESKTEQSLVYIGGKSAKFGQAGILCEDISICAPNCDVFEITGGNTTFTGTLMANKFTNIGTGKLVVSEPTLKSQFVDVVNVLCLVE